MPCYFMNKVTVHISFAISIDFEDDDIDSRECFQV